jgi:hypothetical protein
VASSDDPTAVAACEDGQAVVFRHGTSGEVSPVPLRQLNGRSRHAGAHRQNNVDLHREVNDSRWHDMMATGAGTVRCRSAIGEGKGVGWADAERKGREERN